MSPLLKILTLLSCLFCMAMTTTNHGIKGDIQLNPIKFGMSSVFDGPAKLLGQNIELGYRAYFESVNQRGGLQQRKITLKALNDHYDPSLAAENMQELIDDKEIIAVVGNTGTPTAIVTAPKAIKNKVLLYAAVTGSDILRRSEPDRYVINYRASFQQETAEMVDGLLEAGLDPKRLAFFTQRDGFGDSGFEGAKKALLKHGFNEENILSHGRYERNTLNVEEALSQLLNSDIEPQAVIMVSSYAPAAKYIKLAKEDFPSLLFLNVSFVGSIPLLEALGNEAENIIVTQVVPHFESDLPIVKEYREAMEKFIPNKPLGFLSLEGFISAKILLSALSEQKNLTRESVIDALESFGRQEIGLNGAIHLSKTRHQASQRVWPTIIKNGHYHVFDWNSLPDLSLL